MAAQPQQLLLEELLSTLDVLSEARCAIEGEAALLRSINADLSATLRRLRSQRPPPQQQAAGISSSTTGAKLARPAGGGAAGSTTSKHSNGKRSAAAAKSAATSQATRPGQQPRAALTAAAAGQSPPPPPPQPQRLPAEFTATVGRFASLLQASDSSSNSTKPAAEGFMQRLQHAYGPSLADLQQQQQQWCSPEVFAQQARFLGLVSAALWAVQQLRSSPQQQQQQLVQQLLPTLQAHFQAWLADHSSGAMESPDDEGTRRAADAVRYRNRCLQALLCEQPAASNPGEAAAAALLNPPGVWLPAGCWHPLTPSEEGSDSTPGWQQLLLPRRPDAVEPSNSSSSRSVQQPPRLRYADVQELLLHSRQLQKLQQLLLQLAVESQAAPRLLELLLRGCMELRPGAAAASRQPRSSSSSSGMTHERCAALYRLVAALAAGPVKQRGLGGGCQLVQEQQVAEAGLFDWG